MTESRKRNEIVSTRLTATELEQIQALAGERSISTYMREAALAAADRMETGGNRHARAKNGAAWILLFAPGRIIHIRRAPGYQSDGVALWTAADARLLAGALLEAADVAERPDPTEEMAA